MLAKKVEKALEVAKSKLHVMTTPFQPAPGEPLIHTELDLRRVKEALAGKYDMINVTYCKFRNTLRQIFDEDVYFKPSDDEDTGSLIHLEHHRWDEDYIESLIDLFKKGGLYLVPKFLDINRIIEVIEDLPDSDSSSSSEKKLAFSSKTDDTFDKKFIQRLSLKIQEVAISRGISISIDVLEHHVTALRKELTDPRFFLDYVVRSINYMIATGIIGGHYIKKLNIMGIPLYGFFEKLHLFLKQETPPADGPMLEALLDDGRTLLEDEAKTLTTSEKKLITGFIETHSPRDQVDLKAADIRKAIKTREQSRPLIEKIIAMLVSMLVTQDGAARMGGTAIRHSSSIASTRYRLLSQRS